MKSPTTRDQRWRGDDASGGPVVGKRVSVNLPAIGPVGVYIIPSLTITFDGPALYPRYAVTASSVTFALADLLRRVVIT